MAFNQFIQGTKLLELRSNRKREVLGKHKILEGFDNSAGAAQSYSSCGAASGKPRYGWCPPPTNKLSYGKDDSPAQRQAQVDKLYSLMSQYGSGYKNYMENVQTYIKNPPGGLFGQNVYVPPRSGPAPTDPALCKCAGVSNPNIGGDGGAGCAGVAWCYTVKGVCPDGYGDAGEPGSGARYDYFPPYESSWLACGAPYPG